MALPSSSPLASFIAVISDSSKLQCCQPKRAKVIAACCRNHVAIGSEQVGSEFGDRILVVIFQPGSVRMRCQIPAALLASSLYPSASEEPWQSDDCNLFVLTKTRTRNRRPPLHPILPLDAATAQRQWFRAHLFGARKFTVVGFSGARVSIGVFNRSTTNTSRKNLLGL